MNAYKLADEISNIKNFIAEGTLKQVANMLRQQEDCIAGLEKQRNPYDWFDVVFTDTEPQQVIRFTKCKVKPNLFESTKSEMLEHFKRFGWTPQTKPLSDEEIYEIWNTLPYDEQSPFDGRATYRFARAIEERHGIK
jgi:hypothetical protein